MTTVSDESSKPVLPGADPDVTLTETDDVADVQVDVPEDRHIQTEPDDAESGSDQSPTADPDDPEASGIDGDMDDVADVADEEIPADDAGAEDEDSEAVTLDAAAPADAPDAEAVDGPDEDADVAGANSVPADDPVTDESPETIAPTASTETQLDPADSSWWKSAVFYQVYPRSFSDLDGDGIGDLAGIVDKLGYLELLGVDAIWLSPIMRSPMADHGYDVSDPRDIDPLFGDLETFDELIAEAHDRDIRVTMDLVPNHTSDQHPWFAEALAGEPGGPERERYIFRDGRGEDGSEPPNNWPSVFGGPAWTRITEADGTPGQWYLHIFAAEQPDLNWDNPEVFDDLEQTLRFWLDRGVDGFRIDVAHGMAKPDGLPDMDIQSVGLLVNDDDDLRFNNPGVHDIHRRIRNVLNDYPGATTIGEIWVDDNERFAEYVRPDELHLGFNFRLAKVDFAPEPIRSAIENSLAAVGSVGGVPTWTLSNHDVEREVPRYGRTTRRDASSVPTVEPPVDSPDAPLVDDASEDIGATPAPSAPIDTASTATASTDTASTDSERAGPAADATASDVEVRDADALDADPAPASEIEHDADAATTNEPETRTEPDDAQVVDDYFGDGSSVESAADADGVDADGVDADGVDVPFTLATEQPEAETAIEPGDERDGVVDIERGILRARAMMMVELALPGAVFIYNGAELGLPNVDDLPDEVLQDPVWERSGHTERGRDGCRVPLPWEGFEPPFGFSTSPDTWLPIPESWSRFTVESQLEDIGSTLSLYRQAIELRFEREEFAGDDVEWYGAPEGCLAFRRSEGHLICALNASDTPVPLPPGEILLTSAPLIDGHLAPDSAAWLV